MARRLRSLWVWLTFHRRDVVAVLVAMAVVAVLVLFWMPGYKPTTGSSFGPDWSCTDVGYGDPVCIKKPAPTNAAVPVR